jgi:hypothetical protein
MDVWEEEGKFLLSFWSLHPFPEEADNWLIFCTVMDQIVAGFGIKPNKLHPAIKI